LSSSTTLTGPDGTSVRILNLPATGSATSAASAASSTNNVGSLSASRSSQTQTPFGILAGMSSRTEKDGMMFSIGEDSEP